jgi:hypothetical protein
MIVLDEQLLGRDLDQDITVDNRQVKTIPLQAD